METCASPVLKRAHARRLRDNFRSAGWPFQDVIEIELLAAGLLERVTDVRSAPKRPSAQLPFSVWMALAKATPLQASAEEAGADDCVFNQGKLKPL